jgi:hypothetical protein
MNGALLRKHSYLGAGCLKDFLAVYSRWPGPPAAGSVTVQLVFFNSAAGNRKAVQKGHDRELDFC